VRAPRKRRRAKYGDNSAQSVSRHAVTRRSNPKETPVYSAPIARGEDFVLIGCKGEPPPPEPGADGAKIEVDGWRPGDFVVWDDARPSLRGDAYVFGERIFEAIELYCVDPGCNCGEVIVDFSPAVPRGAPHPGHVQFDGEEATLHPENERQRKRLTELWAV
jgi:hypothetical protein